MLTAGDELLDAHYAEHADKPFFDDLKKFMKSSPIIAMVWEGGGAIETVRLMVGATNARKAEPGTIRGDFGMSGATNNMVHASDSAESATKEVEHFFAVDELFDYEKSEYLHVYAPEEL
jgi:nucleoside-diphosphate kinase